MGIPSMIDTPGGVLCETPSVTVKVMGVMFLMALYNHSIATCIQTILIGFNICLYSEVNLPNRKASICSRDLNK